MASVITLYTDTLDRDEKRLVMGIPDGGHNAFRSSFFTFDQGDDGWVSWLEAKQQRSAEGDLPRWRVKRHLMNLATGAGQRETLFHGCFFDALHHISKFRGEGAGVIDGHEKLPVDTPHFSVVAEETGQPQNAGGVVYPAFDGEIQADGMFDYEAQQRAAKTGSIALTPVSDAQLSSRSIMADLAGRTALVATGEPLPAHVMGAKQDLCAAFNKTGGIAKTLNDMVGQISADPKYHRDPHGQTKKLFFMTTLSAVGTTAAATTGLHVEAGAMIGIFGSLITFLFGGDCIRSNGFFAEKAVLLKSNKLSRLVGKLPESQFKTMMLDFAGAAKTATYLEIASREQARFLDENRQRSLKKGLKMIERAGRNEGLPATDIQKFKTAFAAGERLESESYARKLSARCAALGEQLEQAQQQILTGPVTAAIPKNL